MYSSDKSRNRKERTLTAHTLLCRLDDNDFQGTIKFSFKKGEGLMTWVIEEHGSFAINGHDSKNLAVEAVTGQRRGGY